MLMWSLYFVYICLNSETVRLDPTTLSLSCPRKPGEKKATLRGEFLEEKLYISSIVNRLKKYEFYPIFVDIWALRYILFLQRLIETLFFPPSDSLKLTARFEEESELERRPVHSRALQVSWQNILKGTLQCIGMHWYFVYIVNVSVAYFAG